LIKGTGPVVALNRPVLLIGRHPECDARIEWPKISRRHCCMAIAYDRVLIRDLGSRNGVRVNGRVIDEVRLQPGDEIAIGPIIYRLEMLTEKPSSRPPAASSARPGMKPGPAGVGGELARNSPVLDAETDLIPLDDT